MSPPKPSSHHPKWILPSFACALVPVITPAQNPRHLETIVKAGFASKRKMLRNNLKSLVDGDRLTHLLGTAKRQSPSPRRRPQRGRRIALSNQLQERGEGRGERGEVSEAESESDRMKDEG